MKPWLKTTIALLIALTAASTAAQQATQVSPPASAPTQDGSGGVRDGIKLHGNWVIDVRNPDGTLAAHSEFTNALTPTGQVALADLLAGQTFADWIVTFNEALSGQPTITSVCAPGPCWVYKANGPFATGSRFPPEAIGNGLFPTLTVASSGGRLVLTGTLTATAAGAQIQRVVTHVVTLNVSDRVFTMATLPAPVPVAQGQIVQFTYTLSFS